MCLTHGRLPYNYKFLYKNVRSDLHANACRTQNGGKLESQIRMGMKYLI